MSQSPTSRRRSWDSDPLAHPARARPEWGHRGATHSPEKAENGETVANRRNRRFAGNMMSSRKLPEPVQRNHNPRVGGSSPSSGITPPASGLCVGICFVYGGFRGFGGAAGDRYGPSETAGWLTKQSNEPSNIEPSGSANCPAHCKARDVPIVRAWRRRGESVAPSAGHRAHFWLTLSRVRAFLGARHVSSWARELESSR